jgi:hypothetical protein
LNERFEQYINGKRENLHSNFTLRLKKILLEARSTPTLVNLKLYQLARIVFACKTERYYCLSQGLYIVAIAEFC